MSKGSNSGNTTLEWRDLTSPTSRRLAGMIRRVALRMTQGVFWQAVGHLLLDGKEETLEAEVFSGVGFFARPAADANAEAIVAFPGGAANPAIIATRDEGARKRAAGLAAQDETFMYNSQVVVRCTASGLVQAYLMGGPAPVKLALASDHDALVTAYNAHKHLGVTAGAAVSGIPQAGDLGVAAVGSSVLRG